MELSPEWSRLISQIARLTTQLRGETRCAATLKEFFISMFRAILHKYFFIFSFFLPPPARPGLLASLTPSHSAFCVVVDVGGEKSGRRMVCTNRVVWGEKGQRREVKINTEHPKTEVVCRCCYIHTLKSHRKEKKTFQLKRIAEKFSILFEKGVAGGKNGSIDLFIRTPSVGGVGRLGNEANSSFHSRIFYL